jgi:Nif-specific regulatory protein
MTARLVALAGPLKGITVELAEAEVSVGREPGNPLCINDGSLSRRHCLIRNDAGRFTISDLHSLNGTFVNGLPIKQKPLAQGDQIRIGDSLLVFLTEDDAPPLDSNLVQLDDSQLLTEATVQLRIEDARYLQADPLASPPQTERAARDLRALLRISAEISSIRRQDMLQRRLLDLIFEVTPAERGAILLTGESPETFAAIFGLDRAAEIRRPVQVSRTVVGHVLREGVAVLSSDATASQAFAQAESVMDADICSLLCVPLAVFDQVIGALYLTTSDRQARFDENDLQLVTAVAGLAAMAFANVRHIEGLEEENRRLQEAIQITHNMVGQSAPMQRVYQFIAKAAPTDSTVLIVGENGTGKEQAARAIHQNSLRAAGPFIAINCAALTDTLLESELFGHEKGAFTGAVAQKKGKLEIADGGTLFLDEIGELAPSLQAKLLRVLQEREFERVGGTRSIKVNLRMIAATNRDLEEAIRTGGFRQDLYYRLNVVRLRMPPLRERREDIRLLANYFAAKHGERCSRKISGISAEAHVCLMNYSWPGNVRELENAIERAAVLGSTEVILLEDLPDDLLEARAPADVATMNYHDAVNELKRRLIVQAVNQAGGSYTEAARRLGVHPNYLHRLIRNMNLKGELIDG